MGGVARQRRDKAPRNRARGWFWAGSLLLFCGMTAVLAQTAQEVRELLEWGDHEVALERAEQGLEKNPQDAELRFYHAIALMRNDQAGEALEAFQGLAEEYPGSPEIHNNLAVLYAQQGEYDKARASLEAALNTDETYATAHRNLADIYSAQAAAAYNRALARDEGRDVPRPQLAVLSAWAVPVAEKPVVAVAEKPADKKPAEQKQAKQATKVAAARPAEEEAKPESDSKTGQTGNAAVTTQPLPAQASLSETPEKAAAKPEPEAEDTARDKVREGSMKVISTAEAAVNEQDSKQTSATEETAEKSVQSEPKSEAPVVTAKAEEESSAPLIAPKQARQVARAVEEWAAAWSNQNIEGYLDAYAGFFRPEEGLDHKAWRAERRDRVGSPIYIRLGLRDMRIRLKEEGRAIAVFQQDYQSNTYQDSVRKTLYLERIKGDWKIVREVSEPLE